MSFMLEVYYRAPADKAREKRISSESARFHGELTFREDPSANDVSQAVCLTYEFLERDMAEKAAVAIRQIGEHVEGPTDY
jgi:hypothetical protein